VFGLLAAARAGAPAEREHAAALLARWRDESNLPLAHAAIALFDAIVARRRGDIRTAGERGRSAAEGFAAVGWFGFERQAIAMAPAGSSSAVRDAQHVEAQAGAVRILSERQRQIAELVAAGKPNKTIAATLQISEKTVEKHLSAIYEKLGVMSRAQLVGHIAGAGSPAGGTS
jgi:non-specific serine/threonine protein kinase